MQFVAVALNAGHAATAKAVRAHHWTIPVAYDEDGRVGEQYGVVACPMVELARRGGVVVDRLIGNRWDSAAALEPRVRALLAARDERRGRGGVGRKSNIDGQIAQLRCAAGAVDPAVAAELPGLRLDWLAVDAAARASGLGACALVAAPSGCARCLTATAARP